MRATGAGFRNGKASVSGWYQKLVGALMFLLVVILTTSCGTAAQASGANSNDTLRSLTLTSTLPNGAVNEAYNAVLSVGGGMAPYHFSISSGLVPPGVVLNPMTGSFTGTPTMAGTYVFGVMVTDGPRPEHAVKAYLVKIAASSSGGGSGTGGGSVKISVSPLSTNVASGATQQFTATVTGTSNTAVTWSATSGSINSNGLYTAPSVKSNTDVTITAASVANPGQSAHAFVTVEAGKGSGPVLTITSASVPQAQQGQPYSATFTATGGSQPYTWTVTNGSLPPGTSLSTNGNLAGTPTSNGNFSFTVQVSDSSSQTASANYTASVSQSNGYDGPAQLPLATVDTAIADTPAPGGTINVNAGSDLQSTLNSAQCGDTVQIQAGATFSGTVTVPAKNCDNNHWIIVRTSSPDTALPAEGTRTTPCYAGVASLPGRPSFSCSNPQNVLAKLQNQARGNGPIQLANGANFYRFIGLEITRANGTPGSGSLISLQGTADHIIVDRSWLHGNVQDETSVGMAASGGTNIAVVDSYFSDFHCIANTGSCTDAHAFSAGMGDTQDGPFLIQDNFLEASGEAILFGGGPATQTPTDITITGNHFWKPWQWMKGSQNFVGGPNGNPFIVKNHMELKNAVRVLAENNLMDNVWGGFSQTGYGILLTPKNQHKEDGQDVCPACQVTDVTIRYTQISHAGGGLQMATAISGNGGNGAPAKAGTRWSIHDLVLDDLNTKYLGPGTPFQIGNEWPNNPLNTLTINHVTALSDPDSHMMILGSTIKTAPMYGFVFTNNIVITGRYPVWNSGGGHESCAFKDVPITSIGNCFSSYTFDTNGLVASPTEFPPSSWPSKNMFQQTVTDVQFVNYNNGNGGNYELQPASPYKNMGTDGKDLGADIAGVNAALANVE
jgi:hypothetical protein